MPDIDGSVKIGCCCASIGLLVGAILTGCAFSYLDPLEAGIAFNSLTRKVDNGRVYTEGRYHLGVSKSFKKYPRTQQMIRFGPGGDAGAINTRSNSGTMTLELSLQYRLTLEQLPYLFAQYETRYHGRFVQFVEATIQDEGSNIEPNQYYTDRQAVTDQLLAAVRARFENEPAEIVGLQLRDVQLPSQNAAQIVNNNVKAQEQLTIEKNGKVAEIEAEENVIRSEVDREIQVIASEAQREAAIILQTAEAQARALKLTATSTALLTALSDALGFASSEVLVYQWQEGLRALSASSQLAVSFESAIVAQPA